MVMLILAVELTSEAIVDIEGRLCVPAVQLLVSLPMAVSCDGRAARRENSSHFLNSRFAHSLIQSQRPR